MGTHGSHSVLCINAAQVLLVLVVVLLTGSALWLPIDWPRYFLPAAPCLALLEALALATLARAVVHAASRSRPGTRR